MDIFKVIQPSRLLIPYIKQYWFVSLENITPTSQRMLPNGCAALYFLLNGTQMSSETDKTLPAASYLYGQSTTYDTLTFSGTICFIAVIFRPAATYTFFDIPQNEMANLRLPLYMLKDKRLVELNNILPDITDVASAIQLIENYLISRLECADSYLVNRLNAAINSISRGVYDIPALAGNTCLSYKQFKRVFTGHVGLNPKDYIRTLRFQRTLHLLQVNRGITITQLAEECGYYDKSHLIKDMKEFSGHTPGSFLSVSGSWSEYHHLFRSVFLDNPL